MPTQLFSKEILTVTNPLFLSTYHSDIVEETLLKIFEVEEKATILKFQSIETEDKDKLTLTLGITDDAAATFVKNCNSRFPNLHVCLEEKVEIYNDKRVRKVSLDDEAASTELLPILKAYWESHAEELKPYQLKYFDSDKLYDYLYGELNGIDFRKTSILSDFLSSFLKEQSFKSRNTPALFPAKTNYSGFPTINEDLSTFKLTNKFTENPDDKCSSNFTFNGITQQQTAAIIHFLNGLFPNCAKVVEQTNNQAVVAINNILFNQANVIKAMNEFIENTTLEQNDQYYYDSYPRLDTKTIIFLCYKTTTEQAAKQSELSTAEKEKLAIFYSYLDELQNTKLDYLLLASRVLHFDEFKAMENPTLEKIYQSFNFDDVLNELQQKKNLQVNKAQDEEKTSAPIFKK